eukprot:CAMPEP_0114594274 /NCGR_PEP_ID=MMETSP0125-20121206/15903_1 /TAXON_ID=485358 ORGANISM="Aristerostoma sp., Strain ATCC 50986" /NCGR_SAMPLE_ID=MMETSP0125 /ASSEMBLY_ACC=CAM_ASM_000245 /LENGTH=222 /DNA_ID=CAMNT_0001794359 /DNA_START=265 /DNA_END=933 /DNA_ORIENTATION=-
MTGCDFENKYYIYQNDEEGDKKGHKLMRAKEKSGWCARNCMHPDCKPFKVIIEHEGGPRDGDNILELNREFRCTCCCFNRPEMDVNYVENGANEYVGKVTQPWYCCDKGLMIWTAKAKMFMKSELIAANSDFSAKCPARVAKLSISDMKKPGGESVGIVQKRTAGCVQSAITTADNFSANFPDDATPQTRALIMSSILLMDFAYFEEKQDNRNKEGGIEVEL